MRRGALLRFASLAAMLAVHWALDAYAAHVDELEAEADELREIAEDLEAEADELRARLELAEALALDTGPDLAVFDLVRSCASE